MMREGLDVQTFRVVDGAVMLGHSHHDGAALLQEPGSVVADVAEALNGNGLSLQPGREAEVPHVVDVGAGLPETVVDAPPRATARVNAPWCACTGTPRAARGAGEDHYAPNLADGPAAIATPCSSWATRSTTPDPTATSPRYAPRSRKTLTGNVPSGRSTVRRRRGGKLLVRERTTKRFRE